MAKSKEVAETSKKSVSVPEDIDLLGDAGAGGESIEKDDMAIPRLNILQALSPQCQKRTDEYVEGAEPGHFWNTVDEEIIDGEKGMLLIPVSYRRCYIEWKLREDGGGFIADHGNDDTEYKKCERDDKGRTINADGHEIKQTAEYFVLYIDGENNPHPAVISMTGTQLKKSRQLNTKLMQLKVDRPDRKGKFNPAFFYSCFNVTTAPESNDKGDWMGWRFKMNCSTLELENGAEIYKAASKLREQINKGLIKVDKPAEENQVSKDEDDEAPM